MGTVTQPSSSGLGGDGSACEDWSLIPEELSCEKNPFLEMSQDQMQKLDAVLSSEQAKALLQETTHRQLLDDPEEKLVAMLGGAPGSQTSQGSSQTQLPREIVPSLEESLKDLDNLMEPKPDDILNVLEQASGPDLFQGEEDVANMAKEILGSDLDEPVLELDVVLLDHSYSLLPADFVKGPRTRKQEPEDAASASTSSATSAANSSNAEAVTSSSSSSVAVNSDKCEQSTPLPPPAQPLPPPLPPPPQATKPPAAATKPPEAPVRPSPVRRSQRQIDRIEREQLEKIKAENAEMQRREREEMEKLKALQQQEETQQKVEKADDESKAENEDLAQESQVKSKVAKGKSSKVVDDASKVSDKDNEIGDDEVPKKGKRTKGAARRGSAQAKKTKDIDSQDEQKESEVEESGDGKKSKGLPKRDLTSTEAERDSEASDTQEDDWPLVKSRKRRSRARTSRAKENQVSNEDKVTDSKGSPLKKASKVSKNDVEAAVEKLHSSPKRSEKTSKKKADKAAAALKKSKKGSKKDSADEKTTKKDKALKKESEEKALMKKTGKKVGTDKFSPLKTKSPSKGSKKSSQDESTLKSPTKVIKSLSEKSPKTPKVLTPKLDKLNKKSPLSASDESPRVRKISEADSVKSEGSGVGIEKRKIKKPIRRESFQVIPDLEPALFSTPDVMVKKRTSSVSQENTASARKDSVDKAEGVDEHGVRKDSVSDVTEEQKIIVALDEKKELEIKPEPLVDTGATDYVETVAAIEKAIQEEANRATEFETGSVIRVVPSEEIKTVSSPVPSLSSDVSISSTSVTKEEKPEVQSPTKVEKGVLKAKVQSAESNRLVKEEKPPTSENKSSKASELPKGSGNKDRRQSVSSSKSSEQAADKRKRHPDMIRRLKKKSVKESSSPRKGSAKHEGNEESSSDDEIAYSDNPDDSDWCSEDDPDRPWCICRKPHDDRFMICCDRCHDWFHGSCVGVTRSQGRQWEKEGKEWICPRCPKTVTSTKQQPASVEKEAVVKPERAPEKQEKKQAPPPPQPSAPAAAPAEKKNHQVQAPKPKQILNCGNNSCGKTAAPNSAFCSEECLEKHAKESLAYIQQSREVSTPGKGTNSSKPPGERRVLVIDRQNNKLVSGSSAPTETNLLEWLKAHPNFAVLRPGVQKVSKPPAPANKVDTPKAQPKAGEGNNSNSGPDPVRLNVRRTLRDALAARCKDADDILLSGDEIKNIAVHIEEALFKLFKDIGSKYKARYRSLVFNIKDVKNQGLFRKILRGKIQPERLVKMSPEELASQELAKWRERETKHTLEMIQREQLEQQQQQGGHVIKKTHKGEVEIEDEDLKLFELAETQKQKGPPDNSFSDNLVDTTENHRSHLFDLNCKICTGKIAPPTEEPPPKKARVARTIMVDSSPVQPKEEPSVPKQEPLEEKPKSKPPPPKKPSVVAEESSDHEPSSTVCLSSPDSVVTSQSEATPATPQAPRATKDKSSLSVWKGFITMQEVSKFVTSAHKVSGPTDFLSQDIPDTIQVCGRISPDQVWDYLSKIKQSGNKELIIIRFQPANEEEKLGYGTLYSYLSTRKRYGVVGNHARMIKDFYIVPLASHSPVPTVLMPFDGPGLDAIRPHLLLGVIVRHKSRPSQGGSARSKSNSDKYEPYEPSYTPPINTLPSKSPSDSPGSRKHRLNESQDEERSYTPPLDKMPRLLSKDDKKLDESTRQSIDDADKPYDPEESDVGLNPSAGKGENISSVMPSLLTASAVSTQSVSELIDQISKSSNPAELTTRMLASIASSTDLEQQKHLLMELTQKVEEQKRQLEQQRLRTLGNLGDFSTLAKVHLSPLGARSGSNTPLYTETSNPGQDPFYAGVSVSGASKITSETIVATASSISLPPKLQEMLDSVRKKSLEPKLYSPKEQSSQQQPQTNILVDDPIVKKYAVAADDMGDVDLRVLPFSQQQQQPSSSTPAKEATREEASESGNVEKQRIDPRLKGKSYQQDPRTKAVSKEQETSVSNSGSSLSAMSASELVERARKQLEEMEAMEKPLQTPAAATVPTASYSTTLVPSAIQAQQPPPPGVDPCDLVQPATHSSYTAPPPMVRNQESLASNMPMYSTTSMPVSGYTSHMGTYPDVAYGYSTGADQRLEHDQSSATHLSQMSYHPSMGPLASSSRSAPVMPAMPPDSHGYCAPPYSQPYQTYDHPRDAGGGPDAPEGWWNAQGSSSHKQDRDERRQWNQGWRRRDWQRKDGGGGDRRTHNNRNGDRWTRSGSGDRDRDRDRERDRDSRDKGWQQQQHKWQKGGKQGGHSDDKNNKDKDWRPKRKERD